MGRIILALLLLVGGAARARADQDAKTERARIHLKAAIAYYDEARYEDAAREMESAYALKPLPDLQYNLAQCYERLGRYTDAAAAYETYLKANAAAPDRKLVETRIANLRERAAAVMGCYNPTPPPGSYRCSTADQSCPSGQHCTCGLCVKSDDQAACGFGVDSSAVAAVTVWRAGGRVPVLSSHVPAATMYGRSGSDRQRSRRPSARARARPSFGSG